MRASGRASNLADEPERHLHPRLQREAARWLVDTVHKSSSQVILATHSVPFLNLGPEARYTYVRRQPGELAHVSPIETSELQALTEIALDLGLDRGELMALVRVLLFVEGRADQAVLEALCAEDLHANGIAVIPLHGHSRAVGILEAEVLMRFTSAPAAVWLDNVPAEVIAKLKSDREFALQAEKYDKNDEVRTMAKLLLTAEKIGKEVEPLPQPCTDVFDLLDEEILRDFYPNFPGHAAAVGLWRAEKERGGPKNRKKFYEQRFAIPADVEAFSRVARKMAEEGRRPAALQEVIDSCERLAFDAEVKPPKPPI